MAGEIFLEGQSKTRPGVYVRTEEAAGGYTPGTQGGIVAAVIRADWGPAGPTELNNETDVTRVFGTGDTTDVARQAFRGGARRVVAVRAGTGGTKATVTLQAAAVDAVELEAKYVGLRGNAFTVTKRAALVDATKNEVLLFEGTTLLEAIQYAPGADDATALVAAVNAQSNYLDATVVAVGDVDDVNQEALATGAAVVIDAAAYLAGLGLLDTETFDVAVLDSETAAVHASAGAWLEELRSSGKRSMLVVGEPTSVAFATRKTNSAARNSGAVVYVLNGFSVGTSDYDGAEAAGRVAGVIAAAAINSSITHATLAGATALVGTLTNSEIEQAIEAGAIVFTKNASGFVQIEYGITTLVNPPEGQDDGWKKIRRTRTRDRLINDTVMATDALVGKVNNDSSGAALLRAAIQGAINGLISTGALRAGAVTIDPANPAAGDSIWFVIEVDDNDSAEKVYLAFGFRFAPPLA